MSKRTLKAQALLRRTEQVQEQALVGVELAKAAVLAGYEKKATDPLIVDVRDKVDYTDFVVVLSGRSDRQVAAIAHGVQQVLLEDHRVKCISAEGLPKANWVLLDFGDVIVHVFHEEVRDYYDLEGLWIDAARIDAPDDGPSGVPLNDAVGGKRLSGG